MLSQLMFVGDAEFFGEVLRVCGEFGLSTDAHVEHERGPTQMERWAWQLPLNASVDIASDELHSASVLVVMPRTTPSGCSAL
jgi:hypothetical protein